MSLEVASPPKGEKKRPLEITNKDLKDVQNKLKKFRGQYMEELIVRMDDKIQKGDIQYSKDKFTTAAIYNIYNGITKNQFLRIALYKTSHELLKKYERQVEKVLV